MNRRFDILKASAIAVAIFATASPDRTRNIDYQPTHAPGRLGCYT